MIRGSTAPGGTMRRVAYALLPIAAIIAASAVAWSLFGADTLAILALALAALAVVVAFVAPPFPSMGELRGGVRGSVAPIIAALSMAFVAASGAVGGRPFIVVAACGILVALVVYLSRSLDRNSRT